MRPGKPLTFGRIGEVPLLRLPGNPVSSMVTFELFVRPVLRRARRAPDTRPAARAGAGLEPIDNPGSRPGYLRGPARARGGAASGARPTGQQGSAILRSHAPGGWAAVVPGDTKIPKGREVDVILLLNDGGVSH